MTQRYLVGIDLGTTNTVVAYVDLTGGARDIRVFELPQLVAEGEVARRPTLPSFCYLAGPHDVAPGSLALPWDRERAYAVGELARAQGVRVPGRLVSSAKSWLCHGGVDREAPILPWGGAEDVSKLSPVEASARYLQHIREAWNVEHPADRLEDQSVVLTVPASFDEVARELTVEAAHRAGLPHPLLIEEPQAAFYAWLADHEGTWQAELEGHRLAIVVDVGGGTTDFSLIAVRAAGEKGVELERVAVGDHLLLGGDNMDLALARLVEEKIADGGGAGERLDTQRWQQVAAQCRGVKEEMLADLSIPERAIRVMGRGTSVIGAVRTARLLRAEVEHAILEGFFPAIAANAMPRSTARPGLREWGLPFATEPEIPRHLAAFLARQRGASSAQDQEKGDPRPGDLAQPDLILFNGGALTPPIIRERIAGILASWFEPSEAGQRLRVLPAANLDLAVARGAAYYGLARRGRGVRIGGGSPRAYYLGVETEATTAGGGGVEADAIAAGPRALCLVPRGMQEGEEVVLSEHAFELRANQPAAFPLYASSVRTGDKPGDLVVVERETLSATAPIETVLRFGKKRTAVTLPVLVVARLTEVGTLEIWCQSRGTPHRWRLQFQLRGSPQEPMPEESGAEGAGAAAGAEIVISAERIAAAVDLIRATFGPPGAGGGGGDDPVALTRRLVEALEEGREGWPLKLVRTLWDALWQAAEGRARGPDHEARWLNLAGFCLRPGFGDPLDEWRVAELWTLFGKGLVFPRARQGRAEWWSLWKRVGGGLTRVQQEKLFDAVAPWLVERRRGKAREGRSNVGPHEIREMWQAVAACERLKPAPKTELGAPLVDLAARGKATDQELWALARLGARQPLYGPLDCVVPRKVVAGWVERLIGGGPWARPEMTGFALVQLARAVGDRERDLDESLRQRVADRLRTLRGGERAARGVLEALPVEAKEQARLFDESLPAGLRLVTVRD